MEGRTAFTLKYGVIGVMNNIYYAFGEDKPFYAVVVAKDPQGVYSPYEND